MPGPAPKPAALRQRRNKAPTRAILTAGLQNIEDAPKLPRCPNEGRWHKMARQWWAAVWTSPMSSEFLDGDIPALFRLVVLVDAFWKEPNIKIGAEIRMLEREFGLTPLSRRRLEWSVVQAEESKDKFEQRRVQRATVIDYDPRSVLSA